MFILDTVSSWPGSQGRLAGVGLGDSRSLGRKAPSLLALFPNALAHEYPWCSDRNRGTEAGLHRGVL